MKTPSLLPIALLCLAWLSAPGATPSSPRLTSATATEVHPEVTIKKPDEPPEPLTTGRTIAGEDELQTGSKGSEAEIQFNDHTTVARFESGTLFTFSVERGWMDLVKGLALVSVKDGSEVICETCALSNRVHSTAIIESFPAPAPDKPDRCATKFILLEGGASISTRDGKHKQTLRGGQMIVQFSDDPDLRPIQEVDVKRLVRESRIVKGFKSTLPGAAKIQAVIDRQQKELWLGTLEPTRHTIGGRGSDPYPEPSKPGLEAPFDPDVAGGIKPPPIPCAVCP